MLKLEGDFQVTVYREVNGENNKEIISQENFEKCKFSEPVKISPINLLQNESAGRIYFEITCSSAEPEVLHLNILKLSKSYKNENEIDKVASIKLLTRWFKVAAESSSEWSSVSREWKSASKELTSTIFWQQYLG